MYNSYVELDGVDYLIERPIVSKVVADLMQYTRIPAGVEIRYAGKELDLAQYNSNIGEKEEGNNRWPHHHNVKIEATSQTNENMISAMPYFKRDAPLIFISNNPKIEIAPTYIHTDFTINITYQTKDKNMANVWLNFLKQRLKGTPNSLTHAVSYHIPLPDELLVSIREFYNLRQTIDTSNDAAFFDWLNKGFVANFTQLTNQNASKFLNVIKETNVDIQGNFVNAGLPDEPEKDEDSETWAISTSYTFSMDIPDGIRFSYPIIVEQKTIPKKYLITPIKKNYNELSVRMNATTKASIYVNLFKDFFTKAGTTGVVIPYYDYHIMSSVPYSSIRVFQVMLSIDKNDPTNLFNLKQLGKYRLQKYAIDFIQAGEYQYMCDFGNSIFIVSLYKNGVLQPDSSIRVDSNLNVISTIDMDITAVYHVRLAMIASLPLLNKDAINRLKNSDCLIKIINTINILIAGLSSFKDIGKNRLTVDELLLLGIKIPNKGTLTYQDWLNLGIDISLGSYGNEINGNGPFLKQNLIIEVTENANS